MAWELAVEFVASCAFFSAIVLAGIAAAVFVEQLADPDETKHWMKART